jgi:hypothetical protein
MRKMKNLFAGLVFFGLSAQVISQEIELPQIEIAPVNYKYLYTVDTEDTDVQVKRLEDHVSKYNVTKSDYFDDEYDTYTVSFYIPEGRIVAAYDREGKLLRTIEKFNNVKLPKAVRMALAHRFPSWRLEKDVYRVSYSGDKAVAEKIYKIKLSNGDKTIKVKTDEDGNFL